MKINKTLLIIILLPLLTVAAQARETLTFGVVPQQSATELARVWAPILKEVGDRADVSLQFATAPDIPTFEKRLAAGEYDFAYMNPYHYTVFHDSPGYRAIAKARDKRIKGIIVVRKDSKIGDLKHLDNATLAFPAPAAFAASILTRAHLSAIGLSYTPKYVSSHDSVYRTVAKGLFPAGGGVLRTFNSVDPAVRKQLKVLWTTAGYTPHAIAVHPRVNNADSLKVGKALVNLEQNKAGKALLQRIKIKGFEKAINENWDDVRALNLKLLSDL